MEFSAAEQNLTTVPPSIGSTKDSGCFHLPDPNFDEFYHRRTDNLVTAAMNAILSPFAVAANFLMVFIICKTSSLHSPSNLLLACLAISDIFVGLVLQPSYVAYRLRIDCYMLEWPVLVITISHQVASKQITSYNLYSWAETVAFINSSVNPLVCLWRVKSIRNEITGLRIWKRLQLARHRFKKDKTPGVIPLDKNLVLVRFRQITAP